MRISDLIKMGLRNLGRRKARTSLTVIGVIIGTISIMLMIAIGQGLNYNFEKQIMENGRMTIIEIYPSTWEDDGSGEYKEYKQTLDDGLVKKIREIKHVRAVSPVIQKGVQLKCGKYQTYAQLKIMDCSTWEDFGFPPLAEGSYPTPENNEVIVYGYDAPNDFYYWSGNQRKIKDVDMSRDKISFTFDDYYEESSSGKKAFNYVIRNYAKMEVCDDWEYSYYTYMDIEFYKTLYKEYAYKLSAANKKKALKALEQYESIQINVDNMKNVTKVQDELKEMGYRTNSSMEYIQPMLDTSAMLQKVFLAIGAVAFVVAAINIANTMIMSIYERTKEIGIMKVLGCYIRDIKKLFLFEAGIIGFLGGLVGVGLSYLLAHLLNKYGGSFLGSLMSLTGGNAEAGAAYCMIPFWLPFVALLVAVLVGVFSGYIPARRATKISAIEAMKNEG